MDLVSSINMTRPSISCT